MAKRREEAPSDHGERCRLGPPSGSVRPVGSGTRESHAAADRSRRRPGAAPLRGLAHRRRPPPDRRLSDQLPELRPRRAPLRRGRHRPARRAVGRRRPGFRPRNGHRARAGTAQSRFLVPLARPRQEGHGDADATGLRKRIDRFRRRAPFARPGPRSQRVPFPSTARHPGRGGAGRRPARRIPLARRHGPGGPAQDRLPFAADPPPGHPRLLPARPGARPQSRGPGPRFRLRRVLRRDGTAWPGSRDR